MAVNLPCAQVGAAIIQLMIMPIGSYKCRAGWSSDAEPRLVFKNIVAKQRSKKEEVQVGNDITSMEIVKWQIRSQFDSNIVTHYDTQVWWIQHNFAYLLFKQSFSCTKVTGEQCKHCDAMSSTAYPANVTFFFRKMFLITYFLTSELTPMARSIIPLCWLNQCVILTTVGNVSDKPVFAGFPSDDQHKMSGCLLNVSMLFFFCRDEWTIVWMLRRSASSLWRRCTFQPL